MTDEELSALLREVRLLKDLLREIWWHRNGGTALPSSWDRRVTEVLDNNGPA